jgi:D-2-hydroxyacid dehydrogenase (NADP+)
MLFLFLEGMVKKSVLVVTPFHERYVKALESLDLDIDFVGCSDNNDSPEDLSTFEVGVAWKVDPLLLKRWKSLKWIQMVSAGADEMLDTLSERKDVVITSVRGIHANPIATYVLMMMPMISMGIPKMINNQNSSTWKQWSWNDLEGKILCQVGLGAIGKEIAKRARQAGMIIKGVKNNISTDENYEYIDEMFSSDNIEFAIKDCDYCVLALPLTEKTRNLFSQKVFSCMENKPFFINVGRGELVNDRDLLKSIDNELLSGAVLDVFHEEPLSPDSPLWLHEKVIVTPHISGLTRDYMRKVCDVFAGNWSLWNEGKDLKRKVDRFDGY